MEPIEINAALFLVPEGMRAVRYLGPKGSNILPLPTLVTPDGRVVSQWQPNANELELLKNGVAVTLVLHSGGQVAPMQIGVGGFDLR
jgi:hypothetical protein